MDHVMRIQAESDCSLVLRWRSGLFGIGKGCTCGVQFNRKHVSTCYGEDCELPWVVEECAVLEGGFDEAVSAFAEADALNFATTHNASFTLLDHLLNTIAGLPVALAILKRIDEDLGPVERTKHSRPVRTDV